MKRKQKNHVEDTDEKKKHQKLEEEGSERSEEPGNNDSDDSIQSDDGDVSGDEEDNASRDKQKTPIVSGNVKSNLSTQINKDPSLYKPPSNEELNQLKETENLFHSSLFRMQVTELMTEVRLKAKRRRQVENVFNNIKEILLNLPEGKPHELMDQHWLPKNIVRVPFIQSPQAVKGRFQFLPPTNVQIVGSFAINTCVKPNAALDIAVTMPKGCLQSKDHLNQRYLRKRALYISVLAKHLTKKEEVEQLSFTYHHGNHYKPILIVKFKGDKGKSVTVHIHVVPEDGMFRLNRFHVNKNNVRKQWYQSQAAKTEDPEGSQPATPMYNTAMLGDLTLLQNTRHLVDTLGDSEGITEGITLLKVWLWQRELSVGYGGFSSYILSMYVAHLLSKRRFNRRMSSYQVFRNTILSLSKGDWTKDGITLCRGDTDSQRPLLSDFLETFDVVFVDVTGYVNICANMNKSCLNRVRHEAREAIQMLDNHSVDSFSLLFMKPMPFLHTFDNVFHIRNLESAVTKFDLDERLMDLGGDVVAVVTPHLLSVLQRALDMRVLLVQVKQEPMPQWSVKDDPPKLRDQITMGVLLNPDTCMSIIEKGPPAEAPEARDFRDFWGEISQLRRFKDGSICEAVAWLESNAEISKRRMVCSKVVTHILQRQTGIPEESVCYTGHQLDSLLHLPARVPKGELSYGTGEEETLAVIRSYDSLCKTLRNLRDLPLTINSIQGTSPVFRYAEVFPAMPATYKSNKTEADDTAHYPLPHKATPPYTPVLRVVCMMEGSGKWPEEQEPFRHLKAAFHIQLGQTLSSQHSLVVRVTPGYVDIRKDDYIFRVELAYLREIALAKAHHTPEGMLKMRDTEESLRLEKDIVSLPKLTSTLHGIQQQHNTLSGSVRLAKRWVAAQLLTGHVRDEAIELMVAQIYIAPHPFTVPNSPLVGFLRFLHLVSTHDWKSTPLIVNLNNEFTAGDLAEISSKFSEDRSALPLMFIATPSDKFSSHWTTGLPIAPILQRLILLAKESLHTLEDQLNSCTTSTDFKQVFRPPLDIYDAVIHLRQKMVPRQNQAVDVTTETTIPVYQADMKCTKLPVYDFDPVQLYLSELREAYSEFALFFHDCYGGNFIGVLWKPQAFAKSDFKVSHIGGMKPLPQVSAGRSDIQIMVNVEAIVQDFQVIGGGLVTNVTTRTEKLKCE